MEHLWIVPTPDVVYRMFVKGVQQGDKETGRYVVTVNLALSRAKGFNDDNLVTIELSVNRISIRIDELRGKTTCQALKKIYQ